MKVVTFMIGAQPCVIPVHQLVEILPAREVLPIPPSEAGAASHSGVSLLGMLNHRGKAVPVVQVHLAPADAAPETAGSRTGTARRCFLIIGNVESGRVTAALAVERVDAVMDIDDTRLQPPQDVGLQGHPAVSGMYHLNNALAFAIDGTSLGAVLAARAVAGTRS